jgi:hypothetical protein
MPIVPDRQLRHAWLVRRTDAGRPLDSVLSPISQLKQARRQIPSMAHHHCIMPDSPEIYRVHAHLHKYTSASAHLDCCGTLITVQTKNAVRPC